MRLCLKKSKNKSTKTNLFAQSKLVKSMHKLGSFLAVLGFELKAYTLSHSTSPFFVKDFF
jgi:hypothetical protein